MGLGLVMPLSQFPPNVAVGLLASVRVSYYNLCSKLYYRLQRRCQFGVVRSSRLLAFFFS